MRLNRRKKQVDIDSSSSFSEIDDDINANDAISPTANKSSGSNSSPLVNTMPMSSSKTSQPERRRPGRPPRVPPRDSRSKHLLTNSNFFAIQN